MLSLTNSEKAAAFAAWQFGGQSMRSQGITVAVVNGGDKPTVPTLPRRYQWGKPWTKQAGGARYEHSAVNQMHGRQPKSPDWMTR